MFLYTKRGRPLKSKSTEVKVKVESQSQSQCIKSKSTAYRQKSTVDSQKSKHIVKVKEKMKSQTFKVKVKLTNEGVILICFHFNNFLLHILYLNQSSLAFVISVVSHFVYIYIYLVS